jgi:hypothetical protein
VLLVRGQEGLGQLGTAMTPPDQGGRDGKAQVEFIREAKRLFDTVRLSLESDRTDLQL